MPSYPDLPPTLEMQREKVTADRQITPVLPWPAVEPDPPAKGARSDAPRRSYLGIISIAALAIAFAALVFTWNLLGGLQNKQAPSTTQGKTNRPESRSARPSRSTPEVAPSRTAPTPSARKVERRLAEASRPGSVRVNGRQGKSGKAQNEGTPSQPVTQTVTPPPAAKKAPAPPMAEPSVTVVVPPIAVTPPAPDLTPAPPPPPPAQGQGGQGGQSNPGHGPPSGSTTIPCAGRGCPDDDT